MLTRGLIEVILYVLVERGTQLQEIFSAAPGVWVCHGVDPEGNPISLEAHE